MTQKKEDIDEEVDLAHLWQCVAKSSYYGDWRQVEILCRKIYEIAETTQTENCENSIECQSLISEMKSKAVKGRYLALYCQNRLEELSHLISVTKPENDDLCVRLIAALASADLGRGAESLSLLKETDISSYVLPEGQDRPGAIDHRQGYFEENEKADLTYTSKKKGELFRYCQIQRHLARITASVESNHKAVQVIQSALVHVASTMHCFSQNVCASKSNMEGVEDNWRQNNSCLSGVAFWCLFSLLREMMQYSSLSDLEICSFLSRLHNSLPHCYLWMIHYTAYALNEDIVEHYLFPEIGLKGKVFEEIGNTRIPRAMSDSIILNGNIAQIKFRRKHYSEAFEIANRQFMIHGVNSTTTLITVLVRSALHMGYLLTIQNVIERMLSVPVSGIERKYILFWAFGCFWLMHRRIAKAREFFLKALNSNSKFGLALLFFGHSFSLELHSLQALTAYSELSARVMYPSTSDDLMEPWLYYGRECIAVGWLDQATNSLLQARHLCPFDPYICNEIGYAYFMSGNYEKSREYFCIVKQSVNHKNTINGLGCRREHQQSFALNLALVTIIQITKVLKRRSFKMNEIRESSYDSLLSYIDDICHSLSVWNDEKVNYDNVKVNCQEMNIENMFYNFAFHNTSLIGSRMGEANISCRDFIMDLCKSLITAITD